MATLGTHASAGQRAESRVVRRSSGLTIVLHRYAVASFALGKYQDVFQKYDQLISLIDQIPSYPRDVKQKLIEEYLREDEQGKLLLSTRWISGCLRGSINVIGLGLNDGKGKPELLPSSRHSSRYAAEVSGVNGKASLLSTSAPSTSVSLRVARSATLGSCVTTTRVRPC